MKKLKNLFQRDERLTDRPIIDLIQPGSEWVAAGEGVATRKFDGTSCMVRAGRLYRRYDAKRKKTPPAGFLPCEPAPDPVTGHWPGWLLVDFSDPACRWHLEAWNNQMLSLTNGTYELCGPKVQSNPERLAGHVFIRHGEHVLEDAPRTFKGLRDYLLAFPHMEGIVWHHPDGRMVKIRRVDFAHLYV